MEAPTTVSSVHSSRTFAQSNLNLMSDCIREMYIEQKRALESLEDGGIEYRLADYGSLKLNLSSADVRLYPDSGLLAIRGKLFRVKRYFEYARGDKILESLKFATQFELIKSNVYSFSMPRNVSGNFSLFSLYWNWTDNGHRFLYSVKLQSWLPGFRTVEVWVRLLQKRVRRWRKRRMAKTAFLTLRSAMTSCRAKIAMLGDDLLERIFMMI